MSDVAMREAAGVAVIRVRCPDGSLVVSVVDAEDAALVSAYTWHAEPSRHTTYLAAYDAASGRTVWLHRLVLNAPDRYQVDHVNGHGLDNRRSNLRLATGSENAQNRYGRANRSTGVRGVRQTGRNRYEAKVTVKGIAVYCESFETLGQAERAAELARARHMPYSREARAWSSNGAPEEARPC